MSDNDVGSTSGGDRIACEFCAATFQSQSDVMSHLIHCEERPSDARFECEYCHNEYISKEALTQHLKDCNSVGHKTDSNSHECSICGEQFDSVQQLIRHKPSCSKFHSQFRTGSEIKLIERGAKGTVINFTANRGYGFIETFDIEQQQNPEADESVDVFSHVSEYPGDKVEEGDRLRFDVRNHDEGYKAVNISHAYREDPESWDDTFASNRPRWG